MLAKAVAILITYPLIFLKTKAMSSSKAPRNSLGDDSSGTSSGGGGSSNWAQVIEELRAMPGGLVNIYNGMTPHLFSAAFKNGIRFLLKDSFDLFAARLLSS